MLTRLNIILIIISTISICVAAILLVSEYNQTVRWQNRALQNYEIQYAAWESKSTDTPPPKKESWWHENPLFVAVSVWVQLWGNLLAILICAISLGTKLKLKILKQRTGSPAAEI